MSIDYSTNWMGPISNHWYEERGLTARACCKLPEGRKWYPKGKKAGDVWEYDAIVTHYAGGRIDIRDYRREGYDGWHEYGLACMRAEDWNALSDWLDDFTSEELVPYKELIEMFETDYGKKIRWAEE